MAKDAPDPRAQALANRLQGKAPQDDAVIDMLAGAVTVGQRDEEGKPIGDKVSAEEFRKRKPVHEPDELRDDDELDTDEEEGGDEEEEDTGDEIDEETDDDAEEDDEEESDDEDDGDEYEEVAYSDEDVIPIQVDGSTEEVSLRDLKRVYSLHGATEKRLKEATELRKSAQQEREAVTQEIQTHRTNMLRTIQQLDSVLFAELVPKPPAALRTKNKDEYFLQQDAYEEDQKRLKEGRVQLAGFLAEEQNKINTTRATFRASQQKLLAEKMPELLDPAKAPKIQQDIMMAASYYGFGPELVAEVDHHGLFLMARDAARWLNMQKFKKSGRVPTSGATALKRKKHLKPGGTTATKVKLVRSQKEQRVAETKARTSGRVDDVSAMLVAKARRRQPNGRPGKNL
jgi:hypothetical protein